MEAKLGATVQSRRHVLEEELRSFNAKGGGAASSSSNKKRKGMGGNTDLIRIVGAPLATNVTIVLCPLLSSWMISDRAR